MRNSKRRVERGAGRSLDAVIWPKRLASVGDVDCFEGTGSRMAGGEGDVTSRVPVLRQHNMGELLRKLVDDRNNLVPSCNCERSARAEVVLKIDNQQYIGGRLDSHDAVWHVEPDTVKTLHLYGWAADSQPLMEMMEA